MAHQFASEAWVAAYKDALNSNADYKVAGKDWTFGPVAMIVHANPEKGFAHEVAMLLDVERGSCRATKLLPRAEAEQAPFVIMGDYDRWRSVIAGEIDPTKAMMQGKLKLTKGHLPTMLRFIESSKQLVRSASMVPTQFPG